jgi:hypothetical protein
LRPDYGQNLCGIRTYTQNIPDKRVRDFLPYLGANFTVTLLSFSLPEVKSRMVKVRGHSRFGEAGGQVTAGNGRILDR